MGLLVTQDGASLLCWVVDKALRVYQNRNSANENILTKTTVMKILYKTASEVAMIKNDPSLRVCSVSPEMYLAGLELLSRSVDSYPDDMKTVNGFNIAFLKQGCDW